MTRIVELAAVKMIFGKAWLFKNPARKKWGAKSTKKLIVPDYGGLLLAHNYGGLLLAHSQS